MTTSTRTGMAGTAAVILLAFLLFYLPSMLALLSSDGEPRDITMLNVGMATCYTSIFCMNYFLIIPKTLFGKDRKILFFLINICLVVGLCSLLPIWFETHGGLPRLKHIQKELTTNQIFVTYMRFVIRDGVMMILSITLAYALCLSKTREEMRRRVLEMESERRNTELMNLKAQLNPHFLFNSLNNIYALIAIDPDKAQQSLHELSSMLRFMIYDSQSSTVDIAKEMQFIGDFIRLMSLRLSPSVRLTSSLADIHDNSLRIAPLLILTLVENAFKHVAVIDGSGFIDISIAIDKTWLNCEVRNTCLDRQTENLEKGSSGVGLRNIVKQLELLYPDAYIFSAVKREWEFVAELKIKTSVLRTTQLTDESDVR